MKIQISSHALLRAEERGVSEEEIKEVLETGTVVIAKINRLTKDKVFPFGQILNNKFYPQKKVSVIYVIENNAAIVITVIAMYGNFNSNK